MPGGFFNDDNIKQKLKKKKSKLSFKLYLVAVVYKSCCSLNHAVFLCFLFAPFVCFVFFLLGHHNLTLPR